MTFSERISLVKRVTIFALIFLAGAVAAFVAVRFQLMGAEPDDRPPIIVSNGSVRVAEADHRRVGSVPRPGKISRKGAASGRATWRHEHPGPPIKRMEVVVSGVNPGTSTSCGTQSDFWARKVEKIEIAYTLPTSAVKRVVTVTIAGSSVEFDVDEAATVTQIAGQEYVVAFDEAGANLQMATLTLSGSDSAVCVFEGTTPPRLTILQRQK